MRKFLFRFLMVFLASTATARADASELQRTWSAGRLTWQDQGRIESGPIESSLAAVEKAAGARKAPAIVYLHGCSGLDEISSATARFLAEAGYVVFSPDSFARTTKPVSCDVATHRSGLHRSVLAWRHAEASNAVAEIGRLSFVDHRRVYLYGFSEGAIAAATLAGVSVRARVVEGWTCHAGWPEYDGLRAPPSQPILSLTAQGDPWFQPEWARGDCGSFMRNRFGSRSIVFAPPDPLSHQHYLSGRSDVRETILKFLRER